MDKNDHLGMLVFPIRTLDKLEGKYFSIYQFDMINFIHANPLACEMSLAPGRYILCLLASVSRMPKKFYLRLRTIDGSIKHHV